LRPAATRAAAPASRARAAGSASAFTAAFALLVAFAVALAAASPRPLAAATFAGVEVPPPLPPQPVVDTHWGVAVEDPYRFLEDTADPAVQAWMRAQSDATASILARLPGREALRARIAEIDAAVPATVGGVQRDARGRLTYLKRAADANQYKLYRRDTPQGPERVLVDPEAIAKATGQPQAIGAFAPSPNGDLVAYTLSAAGTEIGTLHVIDAATGSEVTPAIDRIRGGLGAWLPDGSGFFYSRLAADWQMRPRTERYMDHRAYLRRLAAPDDDRAVFGPGVQDGVPLDRSDTSTVLPVHGRDLAFALVHHGVRRERSLYRAPLSAVLAGKAPWVKVFDATAQVHGIGWAGPWLYLRSALDAPRFRVLRTPVGAPDVARAEVVVAQGDGVLTGFAAARDALYVTRRDGVVERLWRLPHRGKAAPVRVVVPVEGSVGLAHADDRQDGVIVALGGWTRATRHYAVDRARPVRDLLLAPRGRFDAPDSIEAREVKVASHDGVEVPASIVMAKGTPLDGSSPLLLLGYGAYGTVEEPSFSPRLLAWLERGGVFVIAHVRGGGVYGDAWRRAGWKATKPNTWRDGIAIAEWLLANGYTSRDRLAVMGGSAGGIFVGRAITERPDLFGAAVVAVGNVDSLRSESRANGAANIPEYGTVTREDEFRALLAMSPYANVAPGTPFPAVLLEHGVNDSRVDVWMALKLASRLAAATTSGRPVLLRLDYDAGHGAGGTRAQSLARLADRWAFLLWRAGVPAFQPVAPGTTPGVAR
jgi:prolyl oligopeptidase